MIVFLFLTSCVKGTYYDANGIHVPDWNPSLSSAQNGELIYKGSSPSCASCHGYDALGSKGPSLRGVSTARLMDATQIGFPNMPVYNLNSTQIEALYSWINSL